MNREETVKDAQGVSIYIVQMRTQMIITLLYVLTCRQPLFYHLSVKMFYASTGREEGSAKSVTSQSKKAPKKARLRYLSLHCSSAIFVARFHFT